MPPHEVAWGVSCLNTVAKGSGRRGGGKAQGSGGGQARVPGAACSAVQRQRWGSDEESQGRADAPVPGSGCHHCSLLRSVSV